MKSIEAAAPVEGQVDWASIAGNVTFGAILALACLAVGILLWRWVVGLFANAGAATAPVSEPVRFREPWYAAPLKGASSILLLSGGLTMVGTGLIQLLTPGAEDDPAVMVIFLGVLALFAFYWLLAWFPLIRMPHIELAIDRNGLRASWIDPPEISWTEVTEIRAIPERSGDVAESDLVLLALRRSTPHWTSQACVIDMDTQFGRGAMELLAALDVLRPPAVPLIDPRRLDAPASATGTASASAAFALADAEPAAPQRPVYERKTKVRSMLPVWLFWLALTLILLIGACFFVADTWITLPDRIRLWAPEYRDQEIATALTVTAFLITPTVALAIAVVGSYIQYRREARASAPNQGSVRPSLSGGLILGAPSGDIDLRPILRLLLLGLGLLPMALGVVAISGYGAIGMGVANLLLGAALSGIAAAKLWWNRRSRHAPKVMAVDRAGIHLREPVPFLVPWWAVGMIHADKDSRAGDGLAAHVVDIYARQVLPPTKILARLGRRDTGRIFGIGSSSILILRINPILDLGLTPETVLDALDRFRLDDTPINDRFRIEEGGNRA